MRYVPYIREENDKVQWFMSYLTLSYSNKIAFHNPKYIDEGIRSAKLCYKHFKQKSENSKQW